MLPVLIEISDSIKIYSFGTLIVLAFLGATTYARRRARALLEVDPERTFNICFVLLFVGLAGARLLYCVVHTDKMTETPLALVRIWEGGLVFYGGLLAGLLWLAWYLPRRPELKGWALMDVLALSACLALAIGRWASFLSGMDYGARADGLPFAVRFPAVDGTQIPPHLVGEPLHPVQVYESLFALLLFALLRGLQGRWWGQGRPQPGRVFGLFLALYALGRFGLEYLRGDDAERGMVIAGHLSTSQLLSVPLLFVGVAICFARRRGPGE